MKPKTKPEARVQIKLSVPKSTADAFKVTSEQADALGFDWNATMVERLEKANTEFSQFLAQRRAKVQPNAGLTSSPTPSNGTAENRADK